MDRLSRLLEAALFAASRPVMLDELRRLDSEASEQEVHAALLALRLRYDEGGHGVELADALAQAQLVDRPRRLSTAAMETLALIAYRQPVGRAEIEEVRGVAADGVLRLLQERGLVCVTGRGEGLGRPLLYGTTPLFLELLGLKALDDLPRVEELAVALTPPVPAADSEADS